MSVDVALFNDHRIVKVDERSGLLGGSFYNNPHLQSYAPLPLKWAFDRLIIYPEVTLLDIGASTGCYTLLSALHGNMHVHTFEPVTLTRNVLRENCYLNDLLDKVTINDAAVSNYNGKGVLHTIVPDGGKGVSMVDGTPTAHKQVEDSAVSVVTVDAYCALHGIVPTLIKVDTEGGELQVLQGAVETIKRYHPFIIVEYSEENTRQYGYHAHEMIPFLEALGYYWTLPESDILAVNRNWEQIK